MNMNVFKDIRDEIQSPVLIAGWPGMGSVGVGAISYLRRKLNAIHFADVDMSEYFTPDSVVVENGLAKLPDIPSNAFYYIRELNLIIFESESQMSGAGGIILMKQILDLAEDLNVRSIYTGAAFVMPISQKEPVKVFGVANKDSLKNLFVSHGVEILDQGQISGLNGLLLGFAGLRDIEAACFLATMPQYAVNIPNPKASREILRIFENLLEIKINMVNLDEAVVQMSQTMSDIEDRIQKTFMNSDMFEEEEKEEIEEDKVPQYVMEKIENLFQEVKMKRSNEKATQLKKELDHWNLYSLYEDRFLGLFR